VSTDAPAGAQVEAAGDFSTGRRLHRERHRLAPLRRRTVTITPLILGSGYVLMPLPNGVGKERFWYEAVSISTGVGIYVVDISSDSLNGAQGLVIGGERKWEETGWPLMLDVFYENAKQNWYDDKAGWYNLDFNRPLLYQLRGIPHNRLVKP
jgi:hypothetical protein